MPLYAGTFVQTPVYIQIGRHGTVTFHAADDSNCWSDPTGRVMVSSRKDAEMLLRAHGYVVAEEIAHPEALVKDWRYTIRTESESGDLRQRVPNEEVDEAAQLRERVATLENTVRFLTENLSAANAECNAHIATIHDLRLKLEAAQGHEPKVKARK